MDGVLVDARQWHFEALNDALGLFGFRISRHEHERRFDGLPTREKLRVLASEKRFPIHLANFVNELKQQRLREIAASACKPNPLHLRTLERLRREGYELAVASNSVRRSVDDLMLRTRLTPFLSFTLSNEDVQHPKPDSEIYDLAIKRLECQPCECLVIEDGVYGLAAAKAAGANLLHVRSVHEVSYQKVRSRIDEIESCKPHRATVAA